jgi:choice-of-anchor A domain-containing protein
MSALSKSALSVLAVSLISIGAAHAEVVDITLNGANVYTLGNFNSTLTSIGGAVEVAGSFASTTTTIGKQSKANGYSLVVGGNIVSGLTTLNGGKYYAGGKVAAILSSGTKSKTSPVSFASTSAALKAESVSLNALTDTGTVSKTKSGTLDFKTSGSGAQIFDVSATTLETSFNYSLGSLAKGSTVILNVSGSTADFGILNNFSGFKGYNVLFNFEDASSVNMALGAGTFYGNILATKATLTGVTGTIDGNVAVNNWNSILKVNSGYGFSATLPTVAAAVPEPETYAMLFAGLGLIGFIARKRKAA